MDIFLQKHVFSKGKLTISKHIHFSFDAYAIAITVFIFKCYIKRILYQWLLEYVKKSWVDNLVWNKCSTIYFYVYWLNQFIIFQKFSVGLCHRCIFADNNPVEEPPRPTRNYSFICARRSQDEIVKFIKTFVGQQRKSD